MHRVHQLWLLPLSALLVHCALPINKDNITTIETLAASKEWTEAYRSAVQQLPENPPRSCETFRNLSNPGDSPISHLARTRWLENCSAGNELSAISELRQIEESESSRWAKPLLYQSFVSLGERSQNQEVLAQYAIPRSKDLSSQREKENLLSRGLAAAKNLHLDAKAQEIEDELFRLSPRLQPTPPNNLLLRVGDDFRANQEWEAAIESYQKSFSLQSSTTTEKYKSLDGIRQVHKAKFRDYNAPVAIFLNASKEMANWCERQLRKKRRSLTFDESRALVEGWMQYARDEWSYGEVPKARAEIKNFLAQTWPHPLFKAYVHWLDGRIHANYAQWDEAALAGVRSTRILEQEVKNSNSWGKWHWQLWDDSFWAAALAKRKTRQWQESAKLLEQASKQTKSSVAKNKFLFWLAENEKDSGKTEQAKETFSRLAELDPHDFYGFLAHHELGRPISNLPDLDLENVKKPASVKASDFEILVWLTDANELHLAQRFSRTLMANNSTQVDELLLRAFVRDFSKIWDLFFLIDPNQRNQFLSTHARLFYPKPYHEVVERAVAHNPRVEKEYIYAIMRQESGFDPLSLSPAYAYGLLQLVPQAARKVEEKAGVHFEHDYQLFDPNINIPLGTALMDVLIDQAENSFIMRTEAYNAALEKAFEWRERLYQGNIFEFMEEIPYEETRNYVRLVMRNYIMNTRLNRREAFIFPADLLKM